MTKHSRLNDILIYLIPLALAAMLKLWLLTSARLPFNADEAVVALMARHINQGSLPTFFYGQSYLGSLDAILVALGFRWFGERVLVIRVVQSLLYLGTVASTIGLAKRVLRSHAGALFAGLLVGLPPVNVSLYTTVSLGGYGEMLLLGNFLILGGLGLIDQLGQGSLKRPALPLLSVLLWSFGAGFAFWVFGLTLVYTIPLLVGIVLTVRANPQPTRAWQLGLVGLAGGLLGSLPWWFEAVLEGNPLILTELAGGAIANANQGFWLLQPLNRLVHLFVFGGTVILGLRPPWGVDWLVLPLLPLVLLLWSVVLLHSVANLKQRKAARGFLVIGAMGLVLAAGFIFTPYGDDPSGRYFLPLILPMAIFGAAALLDLLGSKPVLQGACLAVVLAYHLLGTFQAERISLTGLTTQFDPVTQVDHTDLDQLIEFLEGNGLNRGYTNYWVAYPLAFLSREELVYLPRLPYHEDFRYTSRDDRYPPYQELVEAADQKAYITTNHPDLDDYLRDKFAARGMRWKEKVIGDYHIFYGLSLGITPAELGLGSTTTP